MRQQKLEGRIVTKKAEMERAGKLRKQILSIIERARDSTLMDTEYDARLIEELFRCSPISVVLPVNPWTEHPKCDHNGVIHERWFFVSLYISSVTAWLERQGLLVGEL